MRYINIFHFQNNFIRLIFFYLLFFFVAVSVYARNGNENIRIIFATLEPSENWISGVFHYPQPTRGRWHAFLLPPEHEISRQTGGLVSFNHRVELIEGRFEFRYATKGEWVLGVFQDLNRNTLLDLGVEPFYIAGESPVNFQEEAVFVDFGFRADKSYKILLREFPEEYPWAVILMDEKRRPLFARPFHLPYLVISDLLPPFHFVLAEDRNEDGFLEENELEAEIYRVEKSHPGESELHYFVPWHPLNMRVYKDEGMDVFLVSEKPEGDFRLALLPDEDGNFSYYDVPSGDYILEFSAFPDGPVFSSRTFSHPSESDLSFRFSSEYGVSCNKMPEQSGVLVFYENNKPLSLSVHDFCRTGLFQPGSYRLFFYDPFIFPSPENASSLPGSGFMKNVAEAVFVLNEKNKNLRFTELQITDKRTHIFTGQYRVGAELLPQETRLYFFQHLQEGVGVEILEFLELSDRQEGELLSFSFGFDGSGFAFFVDFNGNGLIDEEERAFGGFYRAPFPEGPVLMDFPVSNDGALQITFAGPFPGRHFLEIYRPDKTDLPPLAASFLSEQALVFTGLPRLINLRFRLVFDVNNNGLFDDEDVFYQEVDFSLPLPQGIFELLLRIKGDQLFIETKSD